MRIDFNRLEKGLKLAAVKKKKKSGFGRTSSIAYSKSRRSYQAGNLASDTNLLDITSEQAALVLSIQRNDFRVNHLITLIEENNSQQVVSPLVLKLIKDYEVRVGRKLRYTIVNRKKKILFDTKDISRLISFYNPPIQKLSKTKNNRISNNYLKIKKVKDIKSILKKYALMGVKRNFLTYDSATGYGTALLTDKGKIYFSGQYSAFDKRVALHSEMAAVLSVLMNGPGEKITHLGLVSTKFDQSPCQICGCCRQFLTEISNKYNFKIKFYCLASKNNIYHEYSLDQLLSNQWSSGNL